MKRYEFAILIVTIIAILIVAFMLMCAGSIHEDLRNDVLRITYQFALIVVAGGGISWLYQQLALVKDKDQARREEFIKMRGDLVSAYNSYKEIKRLLRAKALRQGPAEQEALVKVDVYDDLLERLNRVQLEFETYKRFVKGRSDLFGVIDDLYKSEEKAAPIEGRPAKGSSAKQQGSLYNDLETIEKYLNVVVDEYENALRSYDEKVGHIPLRQLTGLGDFIAPGDSERSSTKGGAEQDPNREDATKAFHSAIDKLSVVAARKRDGVFPLARSLFSAKQ